MTDISEKCIVLKVNDYRDDDRLAKVLTAESGMVTVLLRGVKKAKAKLKPFAQEFSVFDTRLVSNRGAFLTPIEPLLIQDGFSLCTDLKVFTAASIAAEATVAALGDDEPHPHVFLEMLRLLDTVADGNAYYKAAVYILRLLSMTGFHRDYASSDDPHSPVQLLGHAQKYGYDATVDEDLSRRALKYICREFEHNFDIGLKSSGSIDLYA